MAGSQGVSRATLLLSLAVAVATLAAGLALAACGRSAPGTPPVAVGHVVDTQNSRRAWSESVSVPAGVQVVIYESENPTTGYRWSLRLPPGVTQVGSSFTAPSPSAPAVMGAGGVRTFTVRADQAGLYRLTGLYIRPWEPAKPARRFTLGIYANLPSQPMPRAVFTQKDSPGTLATDVGAVIAVVLKENPSTGYSWAMKLGPGLVSLADRFVAPGAATPALVGAAGQHIWLVKVQRAGTTTLTGIYARPSQAAAKNAASFSLTITAR